MAPQINILTDPDDFNECHMIASVYWHGLSIIINDYTTSKANPLDCWDLSFGLFF